MIRWGEHGVAAGELLVVTGDHGSGKTMLLRQLADDNPGVTRLIAAEPDLDPDLSVRSHGDPADPRWVSLLLRLGLTEHAEKLPYMLSRGTAAKVLLAQAFWMQPESYLFDEPFNGLDQRGRELFLTLVSEALSCGAAVVVATHDVEAFGGLTHTVLTL